jgi:hypothetical protein
MLAQPHLHGSSSVGFELVLRGQLREGDWFRR